MAQLSPSLFFLDSYDSYLATGGLVKYTLLCILRILLFTDTHLKHGQEISQNMNI